MPALIKEEKGYVLCHKPDTDGTRKDSNGRQYSPNQLRNELSSSRHAGDGGTDVHHFTVFSISVSATFQLKKQGWGVMKGEKEMKEGEERREEDREGRRLPTPFRGSLQSKFTWFLYTFWLLSNLSSSHFNLFTSHCQERRGKKLWACPQWVGNLSNKTEPSLSLCERSQDRCNCKAPHCNCKPGLWATGLLM